MDRRPFLHTIGGAVLAAPLAAEAQQAAKVQRIGVLSPGSAFVPADLFEAFRRGLGEAGYVEGQNVRIDWKFAAGHSERLSELARQLLQLKVDVIVTVIIIRQNRYPDAISAYREAVRLNRDHADSWPNLGLALSHERSYRAALDAFVEVTRLEPTNADAWANRGRLHFLNKEHREAIDALRKAVRLNPYCVFFA